MSNSYTAIIITLILITAIPTDPEVSALGYGGMFHCMGGLLLVAGLGVGFTGLGDRREA